MSGTTCLELVNMHQTISFCDLLLRTVANNLMCSVDNNRLTESGKLSYSSRQKLVFSDQHLTLIVTS